MRASEIVGAMEREVEWLGQKAERLTLENERLRAEVAKLKVLVRRGTAMLKGQLAALEAEPMDALPAWGKRLSACELALMIVLVAKHPKTVGRIDLDAAMPQKDHATERDLRTVDQFIFRARLKLGQDAIETVRGFGWRCSDAFKAMTEQAPQER